MSTVQDKWTEFSSRLPNLEYMYDEVQLMINVLPRGELYAEISCYCVIVSVVSGLTSIRPVVQL